MRKSKRCKTLTKLGVKDNKRKRGLVKKSMELSTQLGKNVFLAVYDSEINHILVYSSPKFSADIDSVSRIANMPRSDALEEVYENYMYDLVKDQIYMSHNTKLACSISKELP